ncbi:MAG: hypothetical protein A2X86_16405 [Bdellovibrionales bacterium GWA2_49_15]|nr:MAG: hypothetical protein A2X86_16405 [Bdellovibrionales bacterium GWA2_49_15]HAZ13687.1 hypothetical protein [Bdellovibrionales bacterium]
MQVIKVCFFVLSSFLFVAQARSGLRDQFLQLDGEAREHFIYQAVSEGQAFPSWNEFVPVTVSAKAHTLTFYVSPDYLQLGDEQEFFWAPLQYFSVKKLMASLGVLIPTAKMVNLIYRQAELKIWSKTMSDGPEMSTSPIFLEHTDLLLAQLKERGLPYPCHCLSAGHKKDYVLTKRLLERPNREAIYGWFRKDGSVIQPLSLVHNDRWVDYSQGFRAVSRKVLLDGVERPLEEILRHPTLSLLVSDEGPIDVRKIFSNWPSFSPGLELH